MQWVRWGTAPGHRVGVVFPKTIHRKSWALGVCRMLRRCKDTGMERNSFGHAPKSKEPIVLLYSFCDNFSAKPNLMNVRYTLAFVLALFFTLEGTAQMGWNNDEGTSNSTFLLSNTLSLRSQCLYRSAEMEQAVPGQIIRIYYRYGSTGTATGNTLGDLKIRMGQTNELGFQAGNIYFTGLTMVKHEQSYTIPPGTQGEWVGIDLNTPFLYDPTKTLIVEIMFGTTTVSNLGFLGQSNNGRKLYSPDTTSTTGITTSTTLQDFGYDVETTTGIVHVRMGGQSTAPNPFRERTTLFLAEPLVRDARMDVMDVSGRTIHAMNIPAGQGAISVDLSGHPQGLYFVRVMDDGGVLLTERVVKE